MSTVLTELYRFAFGARRGFRLRPVDVRSALAVGLMLISGSAAAQDVPAEGGEAAPRLEVQMEATVSPICGAFTSSAGTAVVDFGDLADVPQGQTLPAQTVGADVTYICNQPNGFMRTITSQNGGRLVRVGSSGGPGNEIVYQVGGGGVGLGFAPQTLTAPVVSNAVSPEFLLGAPGPLQVLVPGVRSSVAQNGVFGTTVFAGSYVDTLTIAVTAN